MPLASWSGLLVSLGVWLGLGLTDRWEGIVALSPGLCPWRPPRLVAEDTRPLEGRLPLVLIHGWFAECERHQGWEALIRHLRRSGLTERYKLYRFTYPSRALSLTEAGRALAGALAARPELDGKPLVIVGHSRGGLVARAFLADEGEGGRRRTLKLITLATPHHGTPLASLLLLFMRDFSDRGVRADLKRILALEGPWEAALVGLKLLINWGYGLAFTVQPQSLQDMRWEVNGTALRAYEDYALPVQQALDNEVLRRLNADHRDDPKIIAYFGRLELGLELDPQGTSGLGPLEAVRRWPAAGPLYILAARLQRQLRLPGLPDLTTASDGLVPLSSASFAGHNVARRGPFSGVNHVDLRRDPRVLAQLARDLDTIARVADWAWTPTSGSQGAPPVTRPRTPTRLCP